MIILFSWFLFVLGSTKILLCPMDGQEEYFDVQVEEVQSTGNFRRRKRNSNSKIFECIISCLLAGSHKHMLEFCENRNKFKVTLKNKKSREWHRVFISFFKELDGVFKDRSRSSNKYAEATKGRFRSNIRKLILSGRIKRIREWKERKSTTKHIYEILCPDALEKVRYSNISAEANHVNENTNRIFIPYMDTSSLLNGDATAHARLDMDLNNFGENQIPPNSEEENQTDISRNIVTFTGDVSHSARNVSLMDGSVYQDEDISQQNESLNNEINYSNSLNVKNGKFLSDISRSIVTFAGNVIFLISEQNESLNNEKDTGRSIFNLLDVEHFVGNVSLTDHSMSQYEDISDQNESLNNEIGNSCVDVKNVNASIADQSVLQYPDLLEQIKNESSGNSCVDVKDVNASIADQSVLQYPDLLEQIKNDISFPGNFDSSLNLEDDLSLFLSPLAGFEKMDLGNGDEDWFEKFCRIPPSNE